MWERELTQEYLEMEQKMSREIQEGDYHIVRDSRPTSYPYDVMRRIHGRDYRINSFGTEIHARYFAAAQTIANTTSEGPSKNKLPASPDAGGGPIIQPQNL